jgi:AraC-like DNA-binding protein
MSAADPCFNLGPPGTSDARVARCAPTPTEALATDRVVSIDTNDVDEFLRHAAGWSVEYRVLNATAFKSTLSVLTAPSLQVASVQHAMGYSSQGQNPAGTLSVVVPVDGARPMVCRGRRVGPMQMAVIRSGDEYECVARAGARFVVVSLPQEKAERCAADLWHDPDLLTRSPDRLRFADAARRSHFLEACGRLQAAVQEQPLMLEDERAAELLEEEFLEGLLLNAQVASSCAPERSRYSLVRQAYRYLQDRADQALSIREICAATRASYATLERGFRETYGMTPKAMMTAMRLARARRALLHPDATTTVTGVAMRCGFVELGRFSVQYRQRFGERPSETLCRVRGLPDGIAQFLAIGQPQIFERRAIGVGRREHRGAHDVPRGPQDAKRPGNRDGPCRARPRKNQQGDSHGEVTEARQYESR